MTQNVVAGEEPVEISHRTVVVGVKMDSQSRELLTWALVKVAQSGDHVIALHVLNENGRCYRDSFFVLWLLGIRLIFDIFVLIGWFGKKVDSYFSC